MYGDEIIRALESSGQKCGARGATEAAGHVMRGILEHSISAGVVSDDEKNVHIMKWLPFCLLNDFASLSLLRALSPTQLKKIMRFETHI